VDFPTLSSLVKNFKESYEASWHTVLKAYIGLPFSYQEADTSRIQWRCLPVDMSKPWVSCAAAIDQYVRGAKKGDGRWGRHLCGRETER
jgi:hypothetical protein